ncbi:putative QCR9-ubiquinol--cytochrome-c reductase subunit 9 [Protomyces lactucae-debilis]|uniref:Complex III subunit 9 n=1 Tax=Protomyces lactucae-debilis TaxID=2754530 RepID=A0A1Y2F8W4_PROLT|nr:putative QCR9-ubiquinol--cytochrome-c reductase subunit 9 [Protomyces lactucae-debilis]ORY79894.1 putative QCR9-ubiquinol--cytochrome-c reductase subunit 9 [Protomyces lactucae-debilis]
MSLASTVYQTVFKRNSVFIGTVFATGFAFKIAFDMTTTSIWDNANKGKQWKDIRSKYVEQS